MPLPSDLRPFILFLLSYVGTLTDDKPTQKRAFERAHRNSKFQRIPLNMLNFADINDLMSAYQERKDFVLYSILGAIVKDKIRTVFNTIEGLKNFLQMHIDKEQYFICAVISGIIRLEEDPEGEIVM